MRLIVTGTEGQVARSLDRAGGGRGRRASGYRPARTRSCRRRERRARVCRRRRRRRSSTRPRIRRSIARRLKKSSRREINGAGAGLVAAAARRLGIPVIQISTDYVFDGALDRPYREDDPTGPIGAYGRSKLAGERAVAAAHPEHVILRTAWVYSPFGANFVKTMLRLGETRSEVNVVADQRGTPTSALDIADAIIAVARRLVASKHRNGLTGVFHLTGGGEATWAEFAEAIFAEAEAHGRKPVAVRRISTAEYPTPARRPANSRLDGARLREVYGVALPPWRQSLKSCVARLLAGPTA